MTPNRIKQIQEETAYPKSVSVQQALLKVWNECEQQKPEFKKVFEDGFNSGIYYGIFYSILSFGLIITIFIYEIQKL